MTQLKDVVWHTKRYRVLEWDEHDRVLRIIKRTLEETVDSVIYDIQQGGGVKAGRVNEAGREIEKRLRVHLQDPNRSRSGGFPDIPVDPELTRGYSVDLEVKTIQEGHEESSFRTLYVIPPLNKITRDSYILILTVIVNKVKSGHFVPVDFRIIDAANLPLDRIVEYHTSNRVMSLATPIVEKRVR